jgi:Zn finger protein HypA/HybF involved in hydrogenase expression
MKVSEIIKLKEKDYDLLKCKNCDFKVYMNELKIFKACGQCGSKKIEVIK